MGSSDKHVVELNGKKYDAVTGKPLVDVAIQPKPNTKTVTPKTSVTASKKAVDGVVRPRAVRSKTAAGTMHQKAQHSKTLMRTVVKKRPIIRQDTVRKPSTSTAASTEQKTADGQKHPAIVKQQHVIHAAHVPRSKLISKFGALTQSVKTDIIPVRPAPPSSTEVQARAKVSASRAQSAPIARAEASLVSRGLARATSHTQPRPAKRTTYQRVASKLRVRPRVLAMGCSVMVALLVIGIFAYRNMPSVAMKVAATRAGFRASLPTYQPAGFSLAGPIDYTAGQVSLKYASNSDERNFKVVQRASSWNSEALLENIITAKSKAYQTYQANGRTIYIYNDNNATWVDGGIWYEIEGNSNLNSDQLLKIANSL